MQGTGVDAGADRLCRGPSAEEVDAPVVEPDPSPFVVPFYGADRRGAEGCGQSLEKVMLSEEPLAVEHADVEGVHAGASPIGDLDDKAALLLRVAGGATNDAEDARGPRPGEMSVTFSTLTWSRGFSMAALNSSWIRTSNAVPLTGAVAVTPTPPAARTLRVL